MTKAYEFAIPVLGREVPAAPNWIHEVKHDGYRLRVERAGDQVRLITKGGHNWTKRFPWIVDTALRLRQQQFVIDGEAVVLGVDGISDFEALHSGQHNDEVQLYAFDVLALAGDDLRPLSLSMRKANLDRLLRGRAEGIFVAPFEKGELGPALFPHAVAMGLEGFVSKQLDRPYRGGRCDHWRKVKNPGHPSFKRVERSFGGQGRI